jgi:hypothetical protein
MHEVVLAFLDVFSLAGCRRRFDNSQHLYFTVGAHLDVVRLQVPVNAALLVRLLQGFCNLPGDSETVCNEPTTLDVSVSVLPRQFDDQKNGDCWRPLCRESRQCRDNSTMPARALHAWNRATRSVSWLNISGRNLIAISRPSFVSVAWYTSPTPPDPRCAVTS